MARANWTGHHMTVESNFSLVPEAMDEVIRQGADKWLDTTETYAKSNLARQEARRDYNLNDMYAAIHGERDGLSGAVVKAGPWYSFYFEFGTLKIEPMPYLRPAKRKGDKVFIDHCKDNSEQVIRRRASVGKRY